MLQVEIVAGYVSGRALVCAAGVPLRVCNWPRSIPSAMKKRRKKR